MGLFWIIEGPSDQKRRFQMRTSLMVCVGMIVMMAAGAAQADYDVQYAAEVEEDGSCIGFEEASYFAGYDAEGGEIWQDAGLGAGGVVETDAFAVTLDVPCYDVAVCVESESCEDCATLEALDLSGGTGQLVLCGFTIDVTTDGISYVIEVASDADPETAALDELELCFSGGTAVIYPSEGPYGHTRGSANTAPEVEPHREEEEGEEDDDEEEVEGEEQEQDADEADELD